jgi:probable HAF family extracellular repeat protein
MKWFLWVVALGLFLGPTEQAKAQYDYTTLSVPGSTQTEPRGINARGQIVGYYYDAALHQHGFLATPHH